FRQTLGPGIQGWSIVALEHVLVLAATRPRAEVDILAGPQIEDDPRNLGQLRTDPVDELAGADVALTAVFQGDPEAAVGDGLVAAGHAHGMGERLNRRVR